MQYQNSFYYFYLGEFLFLKYCLLIINQHVEEYNNKIINFFKNLVTDHTIGWFIDFIVTVTNYEGIKFFIPTPSHLFDSLKLVKTTIYIKIKIKEFMI